MNRASDPYAPISPFQALRRDMPVILLRATTHALLGAWLAFVVSCLAMGGFLHMDIPGQWFGLEVTLETGDDPTPALRWSDE
jgi:hypothetical protein